MNSPNQHSLARLITLHLLPGALTTLFYVILAPGLELAGYPALVAILLAALLIAIPFELGYLLWEAKRKNGSFTLQGIVLFREPIPRWQYLVFPILLLLWGFIVSGLVFPVDTLIGQTLFSWLPDWFYFLSPKQLSSYSQSALRLTFVAGLVVNGFAAPIVEELYFRGYLLPRLARFGRWAPFLNVLLFSLYHFWTPWQNLSRILLLLPIVYVTWWKRNIYLAILTHCALNLIGWLLTFALVFAGLR